MGEQRGESVGDGLDRGRDDDVRVTADRHRDSGTSDVVASY